MADLQCDFCAVIKTISLLLVLFGLIFWMPFVFVPAVIAFVRLVLLPVVLITLCIKSVLSFKTASFPQVLHNPPSSPRVLPNPPSSPQVLPDPPLPSPVQCLNAETDGRAASVTLKWTHPEENWSEVYGYEVRYKKLSIDYNPSSFEYRTVQRHCKTLTLTPQDDGIEPLNQYQFEIQPIYGHMRLHTEWTSIVVFIKWHCRFPGCILDRRKRCSDGSVSDFCSPSHAREFSTRYCLLPGCWKRRSEDYHFCTRKHSEEARSKGFSGLVPLQQSCTEYKDLQKHFSKTWCKEKCHQPQINHILKIVNPFLKQKFDAYLRSMPWVYRKTEQHYHGTQLHCDLLEYLQPCSSAECGICGITRRGFDPNRISSRRWQRFGKGFYLAPNSSKAYDYPLAGRTGNTSPVANLPCRALLVCDVAPGNKYSVYKNNPSLKGPPNGYHSVYGKAKWLWFKVSPHLNYDELVVFDAAAIRPTYILLCENFME